VTKDRNVVALGSAGAIFLLFLALYFFPRTTQLQRTRDRVKDLTTTRQEVALLLPQVVQSAFTTPEPADNVRSWVAAEALKGMEKQLVANDGYMEGKGAQVKLRRLTPQQAGKFLSDLTKVRLVVERMTLQDSDRDGRWDMEIDLKVPSSK
jgi:hypothetical protein